jgi:hypothetical protein
MSELMVAGPQRQCRYGRRVTGGGVVVKMAIPPMIGPLGATDEQSKAIAALGNFGTTAVTEGSNLARYIGRIVGTVPEDTVGFVLGDPLHAIRTLAAGWYDIKVREILEKRKVKQTQQVSLSVAIPLVRGAYDESREGLRELWAQLIASAMDPDRAPLVRISFIETLRQFDPLDALVLKTVYEKVATSRPDAAQYVAEALNQPVDEVIISAENLTRLRCVEAPTNLIVARYGRALLAACSE